MKSTHLVVLAAISTIFLVSPALAWTWGARCLVTSIYVNDGNHAYIDVSVAQNCGSGHPAETRLNIRDGAPGQDQLLKLATSALMSNRAVDVGVVWEDGLCVIERIRLIGG